ncbi:MAG TPA: ferritin-like domain-containing protein [Anaerolineaceae bacterium]|nr:ferritin-like domain-containing protein [Anaerolineaceae bacterium]
MAEKIKNLEDLLVDQLKDLYSAETQLIGALPKMAKAANSEELKMGFNEHLEMTRRQKERIEKIFDKFPGNPSGKKCLGMEGLIKEGEEIFSESMDPDTRDAALIAAAQKVEHYEISGYGTARTFAETLGHRDVAQMLQETLEEESMTDERLTRMAESNINRRAKKM